MLRKMKVRNIVLFPIRHARSSRKGFKVYETRRMEDALHFATKTRRPERSVTFVRRPATVCGATSKKKESSFKDWLNALNRSGKSFVLLGHEMKNFLFFLPLQH
jgi:hypothetical protein